MAFHGKRYTRKEREGGIGHQWSKTAFNMYVSAFDLGYLESGTRGCVKSTVNNVHAAFCEHGDGSKRSVHYQGQSIIFI